jgi:hypothetical protein
LKRELQIVISDSDFDAALEWVVQATTNVVNKTDSSVYITTVFLLNGESMVVETLVSEGHSRDVDPYEVLYGFGKHLRALGRTADAVFVAYSAGEPASGENITVTGYTPDGRANAAVLQIERGGKAVMRVIGSKIYEYSKRNRLAGSRNPAVEVIRGLTEEAGGK